jgi:hypothetical protein
MVEKRVRPWPHPIKQERLIVPSLLFTPPATSHLPQRHVPNTSIVHLSPKQHRYP